MPADTHGQDPSEELLSPSLKGKGGQKSDFLESNLLLPFHF